MTYASSASSLTELIAQMEAEGFTAQMIPAQDGRVTCRSCDTTEPAEQYEIHRQGRTEGASDPDDMALVVALECPHCSAQGTLTLKYGPGATPEEAEVARHLPE